MNERSARHWFQIPRSGDLSLCDGRRSGGPQTPDDKALKASIKENSSQTQGKFAESFHISDEIAILHFHRIGKAYRLSKSQTLSEADMD